MSDVFAKFLFAFVLFAIAHCRSPPSLSGLPFNKQQFIMCYRNY